MRASILYLVGLVGYVNGNTAPAIYNVTATAVVQQPYELSNIAASSAAIDSQQLDIFIDSNSYQPVPQSYKQGYQQTLEVTSTTNEFTNSELIIYQQLLLDGYTTNALLGIDETNDATEDAASSNEEEVSIKIVAQELTTLYGANSTSKNLLTLSFVLSYNPNNNNDGQSTTSYEEYMNSNLPNMTIQMQSNNLPVIQVFDITSNNELDYNLDSIISTNYPTEQPTDSPIKQSTMVPTVSPVTPSPTDSQSTDTSLTDSSTTDSLSDTPALNDKLVSYVVDSKMTLYSTSQTTDDTNNEVILSDTQKERWEEVTQDYIQKSIQGTFGSSEEKGPDVTVSLNSYRLLSVQSEEGEQTSNLRRRLQQESIEDTLPLELDFTTNIQLSNQLLLPQEDGETLDGNELVSSAFRSVENQNEYMVLIKDSTTDETAEEDTNNIMNNVQGITLEVDNKLVTDKNEKDKPVVFEEVEAETQSTNEEIYERDMLMYIIITVIGATFLLSVTVCCCCSSSSKKSKEEKEKESNKSKSLAESDSMAAAGYDIEQHQDTSSEDGSTKYDTAGSQSSEGSNSSQAAVYHSVTINAPPGKLGFVLVNNRTNDLAGITRMKDNSILINQVNVGDLLLSVDEVDCRGMEACDVSELIGSRSENDERVLVLLREA